MHREDHRQALAPKQLLERQLPVEVPFNLRIGPAIPIPLEPLELASFLWTSSEILIDIVVPAL